MYILLSFFFSEDGCEYLREGDQSFTGDVENVPMKWFQTPSVVSLGEGNFFGCQFTEKECNTRPVKKRL